MFNFFKTSPKKFVERKIESSVNNLLKSFIKENNIQDDFFSSQKLFILYNNVKDSYIKDAGNFYALVLKQFNIPESECREKFSYMEFMKTMMNSINKIFSKYINVPDNNFDW